MKRLPESRNRQLVEKARPFLDSSLRGLKTAAKIDVIYPSSTEKDRKVTLGVGPRPLTEALPIEWNAKNGDCLHCGDAFENAVPIAKFKADGKFWIFGQFCGPPCAFGYLREHNENPQVFAWTREMLHTVFDIKEKVQVTPPRFMLKRYGGAMDKIQWKNTDYIASKCAPLATFAMFAESSHPVMKTEEFRNMQRPKTRDTMPAEQTPTGKEPAILVALCEKKTKKSRVTSSLSNFMDD